MLQDEVVRTWSGDFPKIVATPINQTIELAGKRGVWGRLALSFSLWLGRSRRCSGADPSGPAHKLKKTLAHRTDLSGWHVVV